MWRTEVLSTAEHLLHSVEEDERIAAVRTLHRFAADADDRIFTIVLEDPNQAVRHTAYEIMDEESATRFEAHLESALRSGDARNAQRAARVIRERFSDEPRESARESSAKWLDSSEIEPFDAAVLALTILHQAGDDEKQWEALMSRARDGFRRLGIEKTWERLEVHGRALNESDRWFILRILDVTGLERDLDVVASKAAALWPDDIFAASVAIVHEMRHDKDRAIERIAEVEERFHERANYAWLADWLVELDRPHEALRLCQMAVDRAPTDPDALFGVGWFSFVTGDFAGSVVATRRSLELQPANAMGQFNLGVALLARGEIPAAEGAYRRGAALARRDPKVRELFDGALGDFALLPELPAATRNEADRIRAWLQRERDGLRSV